MQALEYPLVPIIPNVVPVAETQHAAWLPILGIEGDACMEHGSRNS